MIRFACPRCSRMFDVSDREAGTKFNCESCGQRVQVPQPSLRASSEDQSSQSGTSHRLFLWTSSLCGILALAGGALLAFTLAERKETPAPEAAEQASVVPKDNPPEKNDDSKQKQELGQKAQQVLATYCYRCHGENGTAEGGFNYILDRGKLVSSKKVKPGDAKGSRLFRRVKEQEMPPEEVTTRPTEADILVLRQWIDAGAPAGAAPPVPPTFIDNAQLAALIHADLLALPERVRRFTRYFTITHLANAGLSEDELQTYRLALTKLINSLSWNKDIVNPHPVDHGRTILRVDIRDYSWNERSMGSASRGVPSRPGARNNGSPGMPRLHRRSIVVDQGRLVPGDGITAAAIPRGASTARPRIGPRRATAH